ncbi:MAG TPA: twin-arginine translocase subunit TatC [Solirubrobacteraceae bacterium]|nr:twin-arginine translocase subunit TatC [Solirubrobacteraceae bacterium]
MTSVIRAIRHEDKLTLVDHLDELRARLIVCLAALAVTFGICMWQNHALLKVLNKPITEQSEQRAERGEGTIGQAAALQKAAKATAAETEKALAALAAPASGLPARTRAQIAASLGKLHKAAGGYPHGPPQLQPVTLGVGEPFTTTITVCLWFSLVFALPVILWELYGFFVPALTPDERKFARPILISVPFFFVAGVLFGYFIVLQQAVDFLINFNSGQFNVLVQASLLYAFEAMLLIAIGIAFQLPLVVLGAARLDIVSPRQLRKGRRYAFVACATIAAILPGEAITMVLVTIPLYLLYELSILLAAIAHRSAQRSAARGPSDGGDDGLSGPDRDATSETEQTVQQIIDHVDPTLSD